MTAKVKPPTVDEIAAKHGWTHIPQSVKGEYKFKKGDLVISFSKLGHGSLSVAWKDFRIAWPGPLKDGDREVRSYLATREEYIDVLLRVVTLEEFLKRMEAKLVGAVEQAKTTLRRANEDFNKFRNACEESQEKV